ncbi:uncharacterized protein Z520_06849 [Fonsecaea multimorphosa CBS 102226]|uniref:Uncharacterized protein n=1 Tax=Fonsecaea multimorphosa CBS 102226 TaxID=1442371 RepID=A0A0D2JV96_9EURO|nr:uncharacterized protein Z520_06849 [Fonsecaea multimorphosa CBS 102226]KIX97397.1 hypothetical protein Z520_06849 [Fonsecaea multimorphosa CBS 102226]
MPDRKPLRTANPDNSIWKGLSEDAFRRTIIALSRATGGVPVDSKDWWSTTDHEESLPPSTTIRLLPYQTEQRLADDLAFISAAQEGVESVAAACVEEIREPPGLIFRVAANEGIREEIRTALEQICACLMSCASTDISLVECISTTRRLVLAFCHVRIISRMRLFLGYQPSHHHGAAMNAGPKLENTLSRMRSTATTATAVGLVNRITKLRAKFQNILRLDNLQAAQELEECVHECFSITTDNGRTPFRTTLHEAELDSRAWFNNKFMMQIDKLGAYYRIPETLSREARRKGMRPLFSRIRLEYIAPYRPAKSSISLSGEKVYCHVHAEVQMVIHYILKATGPRPRIIGTSKAACFLCHLFITEHKVFAVSAWHGRLYDQWTIPDLKEYSPANITALRATIQEMHRKCTQLISTRSPLRPYPLTSRHNLQHLPTFSPASTIHNVRLDQAQRLSRPVSTVAEGVEVNGPCIHTSGSSASSIVPEQDASELPSSADGSAAPSRSNDVPISEIAVESNEVRTPVPQNRALSDWHQRIDSRESTSSTGILHLRPGRPRFIELPRINILAEIESPSKGIIALKDNDMNIPSGSRVVNLEDLGEVHETILEKRDSESSIVLQFQKGGINVCCVALEWI